MIVRKIDATHSDLTIGDYLRQQLQFSRRLVKRVKSEEGEILINGEKKTVRYKLKMGDQLTVKFPNEKISSRLTAENIHLSIVYEDADIILVYKQSGISMIT